MPITISVKEGGVFRLGGGKITQSGDVEVVVTGDSEIVAGDKVVQQGVTLKGEEAERVAAEVRDEVAEATERLRGLLDAVTLNAAGIPALDPYTAQLRAEAAQREAPATVCSPDFVGGTLNRNGAKYKIDLSVPQTAEGYTYRKIG